MASVQKRPDETREQFIARVVANARPLPDTRMALIRRLLPPVRRPATNADAA
ncbi:hypothetical protein [Amycolatopsis sp. NPDC004378]